MNIYIIGAGHMGGAIARQLIKRHKVYVADRNPGKAKSSGAVFDERFGSINKADVVILAVKPQDIEGLSKQITIPERTIVVSIAAGLKLKKIGQWFSHKKCVRVMPNLGLTVGQGVAAWKATGLNSKDKLRIKAVFKDLFVGFEVDNENQIDAVTAISGSGPAYFFYFAQALLEAGHALGLSLLQAKMLVEKTFLASALLQKNQGYKALISQIASKKGTTEAALKVFKEQGLNRLVLNAATAAKIRAEELGRK